MGIPVHVRADLNAPIHNNLRSTTTVWLLLITAANPDPCCFRRCYGTLPSTLTAAGLCYSSLAGPRYAPAVGGREHHGLAPLGFLQGHGSGKPAGTLQKKLSQEERMEETSTLTSQACNGEMGRSNTVTAPEHPTQNELHLLQRWQVQPRTPMLSAGSNPPGLPAGAALHGHSNGHPEACRPRYVTEAAAVAAWPPPTLTVADKGRRAQLPLPPAPAGAASRPAAHPPQGRAARCWGTSHKRGGGAAEPPPSRPQGPRPRTWIRGARRQSRRREDQ